MKQITIFVCSIIIALCCNFNLIAQANKGNLVIVGGGLEQNNNEVFSELIKLAGGIENAKFSIIPAASADPMESFDYFKNELIYYKVKPENIFLVKLAVVDDDSTKDVDESLWKNNGNDPEVIKTIENSNCIWFSGGDQLRITETLFNPDGSETNALKSIRKIYREGAVLGGTSAGAAIMSERMIGSGTALSALKFGIFTDKKYCNLSADSGIYLTKGLGFFENGMIDQHFNQRYRLPRLITAMFYPEKINSGFGIDENTALVYYGKENIFTVMGPGEVTCVDLKTAEIKYNKGMPAMKNIVLGILSSGDIYDLNTGTIKPSIQKQKLSGNEHFTDEIIPESGILSGIGNTYDQVYSMKLIDNKGLNIYKNITFTGNASAIYIQIIENDNTQGFYFKNEKGIETYTAINLIMNIIPVKISYKPLN
jgi:cyanophycinase